MRGFLIIVLIIVVIGQIAFLFMRTGGPEMANEVIQQAAAPPPMAGPALSTALSLSPSELAREGKRPVRTGIEVLRGIVLDDANQPVPEAAVHVLDRDLDRWDVFRGPRNISRWRAETNADGTFTIDTVPLGDFLVLAMADSRLGVSVASVTNRGSAGDAIVRLQATRVVSGVVLDEAGAPLPNARVYPLHGRDLRDNPWAYLPATTDKDGKFSFDKMTGTPAAYLATTTKRQAVLARATPDGAPVQMQAQAPGALLGYLLETGTDRPAGRTGIVLTEATYGLEMHKAHAAGTAGFRLEGVRPGVYRVSLDSRKYVLDDPALLIELLPGASERIELFARDGAQVRGRVIGEDGRRGAKGVTVRLVGQSAGAGVLETQTDSAGGYAFAPLVPDTYTVSVGDTHAVLAEGEHTFTAGHGDRIEGPVFQLRAGTTISGTVTTIAGEPASGANVHLASDSLMGLTRVAIVDSEGTFEIDDAPPGDTVRVWAEHLGFASTPYFTEALPEEGAGDLNFQLHLDSRGLIAGTVADAAGEPIPHATVTCYPEQLATAPYWRAVTSLDGAFRFEHLTEGTYRIVAGDESGNAPPRAQQRIAIDAGQQVSDARLTTAAEE